MVNGTVCKIKNYMGVIKAEPGKIYKDRHDCQGEDAYVISLPNGGYCKIKKEVFEMLFKEVVDY